VDPKISRSQHHVGFCFLPLENIAGLAFKMSAELVDDFCFRHHLFSHSNRNWHRPCRMFVSLPPSSLLRNGSKWHAERGMFVVFAFSQWNYLRNPDKIKKNRGTVHALALWSNCSKSISQIITMSSWLRLVLQPRKRFRQHFMSILLFCLLYRI
jgi:hypothetical protein